MALKTHMEDNLPAGRINYGVFVLYIEQVLKIWKNPHAEL